jgi:hypothetical protein
LGTLNEMAPMPVAVYALASCSVGSDIYLFGGAGGDDSGNSVFKFDTLANQWSTLPPMPVRSERRCSIILDGLVYIVGADDGTEVMRFYPTSETWVVLAPTLHSRRGGAFFASQGYLYAAGGVEDGSGLSVERFDAASNTRSSRTCTRVDTHIPPSPLGVRTWPTSRTSSTYSSQRPPLEGRERQCCLGLHSSIAFPYDLNYI